MRSRNQINRMADISFSTSSLKNITISTIADMLLEVVA